MKDEIKNKGESKLNPPMDVAEQVAKLTALVESMAERDKEKDEKIAMLISIADESRKDKFDSKKKKTIIPRVFLAKLNGKVVVGSRTIIDEVYKDLSDKGAWVEKQIHCYTLEDGTTIDLPLPQYTRIRERVEADVVKISAVPGKESENGDSFYRYTVKLLEDGRELELDHQYINMP